MKVFFASGDVGGARALIPVMAHCEQNAIPFVVLANGHVAKEIPSRWPTVSLAQLPSQIATDQWLTQNDIGVLVFATSIKDPIPLGIARKAKALGIGVIHVLDNWSNYSKRMTTDGKGPFAPDIYTVMDEIAFDGAIQDGIDPKTLRITGHPGLSDFHKLTQGKGALGFRHDKTALGLDPKKHLVVFVSEPVAQDQGGSPQFPDFRGYTERQALSIVCNALASYSHRIQLWIAPHPRENKENLEAHWKACQKDLTGGISQQLNGRAILPVADGVVGMASLLLYEAWLFGRPVVSLQPGLLIPSLRTLQKRKNLIFIDKQEKAISQLAKWCEALGKPSHGPQNKEIQRHKAAPEKIAQAICQLADMRALHFFKCKWSQ